MATTLTANRVLADSLSKGLAREIALITSGVLFIALSAQVALPLPFSPVPLTLQTLAVLAVGAAFGTARGVLTTLLYLAAAIAGAPVLAPLTDGSHATGSAVFGLPTFGYIVGFALASALVGKLAERGLTRTPLRMAAVMILGNIVIYSVGVPTLAHNTGADLATAVGWGLTPFMAGDVVKVLAAAGLFPAAWRLVERFTR